MGQAEKQNENENVSAIEDLRYKSIAANLQLPIQKAALNAFKIEQEKIALAKETKNIIEYALAEYLFLGYLERMSRELLNSPKRISEEIDLLIREGIHAGHDSHKIRQKVVKVFSREIEAILREIKAEQKKDLSEWQYQE